MPHHPNAPRLDSVASKAGSSGDDRIDYRSMVSPNAIIDAAETQMFNHMAQEHNVFDGDPAHYRDPAHFRDACI